MSETEAIVITRESHRAALNWLLWVASELERVTPLEAEAKRRLSEAISLHGLSGGIIEAMNGSGPVREAIDEVARLQGVRAELHKIANIHRPIVDAINAYQERQNITARELIRQEDERDSQLRQARRAFKVADQERRKQASDKRKRQRALRDLALGLPKYAPAVRSQPVRIIETVEISWPAPIVEVNDEHVSVPGLFCDDVDRYAKGKLAWTPSQRRDRYSRSRRYEGFAP